MSDTFHAQGHAWWDHNGPFAPLHALNHTRLSFICDYLPTSPFSVLDMGCGGGLVCEPLARLGGYVTGVDESSSAIAAAQEHAALMDLDITYQVGNAPPEGKQFDVVCALEIIEHVSDSSVFLEKMIAAVKPGGILFISTLNRTWCSWFKAIICAEYVLGWVPRGTHDWQQFLSPGDIAGMLRPRRWHALKGISYVQGEWQLSDALDTNYIGCIRMGT